MINIAGYKRAKLSNAAAGELATELQSIIGAHIDMTSGVQITVSAWISSIRQESSSVFHPNSNRNTTEIICEKGWTSSRAITLKSSDLNIFERLNPELLDLVDRVEATERGKGEGIITATIGSPVARLLPETIESMKEVALKESLINASKKFRVIKQLCNLVNPSIAEISESSAVPRNYRDDVGSNSGANSLNFALQYVHLSYTITFDFENTNASCSEESILL